MKTAAEPIHIVRGEGALLFDKQGKKYIDAISSWWTNLHGHADPYIAQKIFEQAQQLEHVIFAGFTHTPAQELAQRLAEDHLPRNISKIFYSDNGSTSVEVAIKMAIQYWQNIGKPKKKIIAFEHAYHGDTFGSMSVSERGAFTKPFHDYLFEVEFITPPFAGKDNKSVEQFKKIIAENNVAAFIYEPLVMGAGGMLMYEAAALNNLLVVAKENNIICIADEVMTGFYRTGKMFASDYCELKPDIMCLSKGLTGGTMALGITACAQFIYEAFYHDDKMKAFYHGHSFTANPLSCAAALASLDLIEKDTCKENIERIVKSHQEFTQQLKQIDKIENIRQTGTILAFDIKTNAHTDYFNLIKDKLYTYFIENGVLLRPLGNTVYMMPPYCITHEQLSYTYETICLFDI
ncbi:MAG: adenosylmethionine--8-amino-7-oxononanoate transaminase [Chitinophagales bacterium]|nr:adenosylmethionine--8-amino-7-oxononanoate transaminase [Chitinophagales bacterium]